MANGVGGRPARKPAPEFAGCEAIPATCEDLQGPAWAERRYEYWDPVGGIAWAVRDESVIHAASPPRLVAFLQRVAQVRGSRIVSIGSAGLRVRRPDGAPGAIMRPDLSVYVHPDRSRMPDRHFLTQGEHDWPDVVLEVDNTTDVRTGKLERYREWGLPEVWVEVPEKGTPGRPRSLRPGCVIHRLESGRYRKVRESVAIPGLKARDIHAVLNDRDDVLMMFVARRVGAAWGAAEGTSVEDDPLGGWLLDCGRREGEARGIAKGLRQAARSRGRMAGAILRKRGIEIAPGFPDHLPGVFEALTTADESRIVEAASQADDEADFGARLLGNRGDESATGRP